MNHDESDSSVKFWLCIADAIWDRWGWTLNPWILSPVLRIMRSACHNTTFICQMPYLTQVLRSASKCFSWEPSKYNWLCPKIGRALSIPMVYIGLSSCSSFPYSQCWWILVTSHFWSPVDCNVVSAHDMNLAPYPWWPPYRGGVLRRRCLKKPLISSSKMVYTGVYVTTCMHLNYVHY